MSTDRSAVIYVALLLLIAGGGVLTAGCDRRGTPQPAPAAPVVAGPLAEAPPEALTPREVIERVNQLRREGRRALIENYLASDQSAAVLEVIQAVDQLLAANQGLQAAVRKQFGSAQAQSFDLTGMSNYVGVFSYDVEVIAEEITGDRAVVTYQVARRVPLEEVQLVRTDERWLIQDEPPVQGVADEVRHLAGVLTECARALEVEGWDVQRLRDELAARQASVNRRLAALMPSDEDQP